MPARRAQGLERVFRANARGSARAVRTRQQTRDNALPALQQATNALNLEVQSYNGACANKTIYDTDDVEAHKNLVCPKP